VPVSDYEFVTVDVTGNHHRDIASGQPGGVATDTFHIYGDFHGRFSRNGCRGGVAGRFRALRLN
jgi:hypothetical protein